MQRSLSIPTSLLQLARAFYLYICTNARASFHFAYLPVYYNDTAFFVRTGVFWVTAPYRVAVCNSPTLSFWDFDVNEFTLGGRSLGDVDAPTTSTVRLEESQPAVLRQPKDADGMREFVCPRLNHRVKTLIRIANDIRNKHSILYPRNTDYQWDDAR